MTLSKAKVPVAPNSSVSTVERGGLIALCYQIKQPIESGERDQSSNIVSCDKTVDNVNPEGKLNPEVQQSFGDFPKLFSTNERAKNYAIEIDI